VRDGADSRGTLDRETRERRQGQKARTKRENVFPQRRYRRTGWMGRRGGGGFGLRGSEASGLDGPKAEWAARSVVPKVREKNF
jgi:hypothetical protein